MKRIVAHRTPGAKQTLLLRNAFQCVTLKHDETEVVLSDAF